MSRTKIIASLICMGVIMLALLLRAMMPKPQLAELGTISEATRVEVISFNDSYENYHKEFDVEFVLGLLEVVEFKRFKRNPDPLVWEGESVNDGMWYLWLGFRNEDFDPYWVRLSWKGTMYVKNEWQAVLSKESLSKLRMYFEQIGLTKGLSVVPLSSNMPMSTNVVFRKASSIPYVINRTVFLLPDECLSVGFTHDDKLFYSSNRDYTEKLEVCFRTVKKTSDVESFVEIRNDCSFCVRFALWYTLSEQVEFEFHHDMYVVGAGETLSIPANSSATCYMLMGVDRSLGKSESYSGTTKINK